MTMKSGDNHQNVNLHMGVVQFGDTTLTKVFVGGLAWETPKDVLREHFEKYGEILEAVIISDKATGRSKGYGFVTFKEADAAKKACEDATPIINGRRANCNLASLGARRPKSSSNTPPHQPQPQLLAGSNIGRPKNASPAIKHIQWYYPVGTPAPPLHHQPIPFYGYTPTYVAATDMTYSHKMSYTSGPYISGQQFTQMYPVGRQTIMGANPLMPMYPLCQYPPSQAAIGLPTHIFQPPAPAPTPTPTVPTIMSKPASCSS